MVVYRVTHVIANPHYCTTLRNTLLKKKHYCNCLDVAHLSLYTNATRSQTFWKPTAVFILQFYRSYNANILIFYLIQSQNAAIPVYSRLFCIDSVQKHLAGYAWGMPIVLFDFARGLNFQIWAPVFPFLYSLQGWRAVPGLDANWHQFIAL